MRAVAVHARAASCHSPLLPRRTDVVSATAQRTAAARGLSRIALAAIVLGTLAGAPGASDGATSAIRPQTPAQTFCEGFQEGTVSDPFSGFSGVNEVLSIGTPGPSGGTDKFLRCADGEGGSFVVCAGHFLGDFTALPNCTGLSFDARLIDDGQSGAIWSMKPWSQLNSGNLSAIFHAADAQDLTEDGGSRPGWHRVEVPFATLRNGTLANALGVWTVSTGVASDGAVILANVTRMERL